MSVQGKVKFYDGSFGHITPSVEGSGLCKFTKSGIIDGKVPQMGDVVMYDIVSTTTGRLEATNVSLKVLPPLTSLDHVRIGEAAISIVKNLSADDHTAKNLARVRARVQKQIRSSYPSAKVFQFGAHAQGLGTKDGDDDFAADLAGDGTWATIGEPLDTITELHFVLAEALGAFFVNGTLTEGLQVIQARVPIVAFDPRAGLKWDLCVESSGVRSARWLRSFFEGDPNLRVTAMWVKNWFKEARLIHKHNGLSSISVITLVVYYAVISGKAPDRAPAKVAMPMAAVCPDFLGRAGDDGVDAEKVGQLIGGFFEFYLLFDFNKDVVTLFKDPSRPTWTKEELGWTKDDTARWQPKGRNYTFICIQDAYKEDENLGGKLNEDKARQLREAFYRKALELRPLDGIAGDP